MMADDVVRTPFDYPDWDVALRSSDNVLFRLHQMILGKASPVFEGMFTLPSDPDAPNRPQVVDITEDADTIERLLRMCYPVPHPTIVTTEELVALLGAMRKYEMEHIAPAVELHMLNMLASRKLEPLRAYTLAYLYKMRRVATAAAKRLLHSPQPLEPATMPPECADIPASALWALVEYRRDCTKVAKDAVDDALWMATMCSGRKNIWISRQGRIMDVSGSWAWVTCTTRSHPARHVDLGSRGTSLLVRKWWIAYNAAARQALESCPIGEVVMRPAVLQPAVEEAESCSQCYPTAWFDLAEYSQQLAKQIDVQTSLVEMKLSF
ncbi:hypothetical protein C8T65DRAFT_101241 [Cerioporus squamosus]|nr:hypothetical protein C8T65DRAFT_101241 [Cerioporus squamosus]